MPRGRPKGSKNKPKTDIKKHDTKLQQENLPIEAPVQKKKRGRPVGSTNKKTELKRKIQKELVKEANFKTVSLKSKVNFKNFEPSEDLKEFLAEREEDLQGLVIDLVKVTNKKPFIEIGGLKYYVNDNEIRSIITDDIKNAGFHIIIVFNNIKKDIELLPKIKQVLDQV